MPRRTQLRRETRRGAHQLLALPARADAGQQGLARRPHRNRFQPTPIAEHVGVDAVGRAPQRQLAQREQVALAEEVRRRALGLRRDVDLAFLQALQQLVGRQVDQHDVVGAVEHVVGHRLPHAHAGHRVDDVVEALEMLHVHRRPDVDAVGQQLLHVLPALGMARAGDVGVRELVDQHQRRAALQHRVEIELRERAPMMQKIAPRDHRRRADQGGGVGTAVRLDDADDDVDALLDLRLGLRQHRAGLADAGRRAEEDLQVAAPRRALGLVRLREQVVGVGAVVGHREAFILRISVPAPSGGRAALDATLARPWRAARQACPDGVDFGRRCRRRRARTPTPR